MMIRITDGIVLTLDDEQPVLSPGAVVVDEHAIVAVGSAETLAEQYSDCETVSVPGQIVMPGLINGHTHLYGSLARGIPLSGAAPESFVEILEQLWWRLDRTLELEDVYISALVGALDAVRGGTTTVFDHHSSPNAVQGSLAEVARATMEVGLRACLCYEVSDRDGKGAAKAALEENERFMHQWRAESSPFLRGLIGLHASFTVGNPTMERARKLCEKYLVGFHIHVAEDSFDLQDSLLKYEKRVVQRLHDMGILGEWTLAAHGVHIDEHEMDILHNSQTFLVHNPRSNMNNAVGTADVPQMLKRGVTVGLGTDGYGQGLLEEFAVLALAHKAAKKDPLALRLPQAADILLKHNPVFFERTFGFPAGRLAAGQAADLITLPYNPPTPLEVDNLHAHLLFGLVSHPQVDNVMIHGRWVLRQGAFQTVDEAEILARARSQARKLWKRFAAKP